MYSLFKNNLTLQKTKGDVVTSIVFQTADTTIHQEPGCDLLSPVHGQQSTGDMCIVTSSCKELNLLFHESLLTDWSDIDQQRNVTCYDGTELHPPSTDTRGPN